MNEQITVGKIRQLTIGDFYNRVECKGDKRFIRFHSITLHGISCH